MNIVVGYTRDELDDIDEAIQDAVSDDEGRLSPLTLLHHLHKRGWTVMFVPSDLNEEVIQ